MGLKYVEMVKSVMLIFLIGLSLVLTFLIWNSAPYETIGNRETIDTSIAEKPEKKNIDSMIKPYKLHFTFNETYTGAVANEEIEYMLSHLKKWKLQTPQLEDQQFTKEKLHQLMRKENSLVLYYPDEVPLTVYDSVLNIESQNIPEINFEYLIANWDTKKGTTKIHFVSVKNSLHYTTTAKLVEPQFFHRDVITVAKNYDEYVEVEEDHEHFLLVPKEETTLVRSTYFSNEKDEINPTRFRNVLFSDPNAVRRNEINPQRDDYQDNHALMTVDTEKKFLHFVHPSVESQELAIPSELVEDAIDFMNEHGGWTDEYRFSKMNFRARSIQFKLYVRGVPVLGGNSMTDIEQVWGEEAIYQYRRPYFTLGDTLPSEQEEILLPSGVEIIEALKASREIDFDSVEEILPGYYMQQDAELDIFQFEPAWFYLQHGNWVRFSPEEVGGEEIGLE